MKRMVKWGAGILFVVFVVIPVVAAVVVGPEAIHEQAEAVSEQSKVTSATAKLTITDWSDSAVVGQLCEGGDLSQVTSDIKSRCTTAHLALTADLLTAGKVSDARKAFNLALQEGALPAERAAIEKLLMKAMDTEAKAQRERETAQRASATASQSNARVTYGETLREHYLDQGMNIKVNVTGVQKERITLQFALFNEVWAHKLKKGDLLDEMRRLGFSRVDMTDGYDYHVYWDLK